MSFDMKIFDIQCNVTALQLKIVTTSKQEYKNEINIKIQNNDLSPKVQVIFCPSPSPDGQKEKQPLCPLCLCGEKLFSIVSHSDYELEHSVS